MQKAIRASMDISLYWASPFAQHNEIYHMEKVDFWRDIFPGKMGEEAEVLSTGQSCEEEFAAGTIIPPYQHHKIIEFKTELFSSSNNQTIPPLVVGRIYPKGYAWKALNTFPEDQTPFRIIGLENGMIVADTNHPLARYPLKIRLTMGRTLKSTPQRGGSLNDITEIITNSGPGIQIFPADHVKNVYDEYPFRRLNAVDDATFYQNARNIHHIDSTARGHVQSLYGRILRPGMRVLDFMSSWDSHIPSSLAGCTVEGLGLNEQELQSNFRLAAYTIQDLNRNTSLPYETDTFDAVICTISIEYILRPREIMDELHRIIRPGGVLAITISDRWFPGMEILPWKDLHPFERLGLILRYYLYHGRFENLSTESIQGYPRPADDKYSKQIPWSDPVYAVWGYVVK